MSALQVRLDISEVESALTELSHGALQILEAPLQAIGGLLRFAEILRIIELEFDAVFTARAADGAVFLELSERGRELLAAARACDGHLHLAQIKDHGDSTSDQAGTAMLKAGGDANKQFAAQVDKEPTQ